MSAPENGNEENPKLKIFDGFNINEKIAQTVSSLENKYLRWTISIGVAFIILQTIESGYEISYLKGKQESFENTVNTLLDDRNDILGGLKEQNYKLKNEIIELKYLQIENEQLIMKLETTILKED